MRFSEEINQLTSRWNDHQRKKNLPFVTVLHSAGGELANYGVTPLPWPLNWPEPPPRPILAQNEPGKTPANEPAKRTSAPPESKRVAQPLIVIGTPREAAPAVETNSAPALVTNAIAKVAQSAPVSPVPTNNAPVAETSSAKLSPLPAQVPTPVQTAPPPVVESSPAKPSQPDVVKAAAKVEPPVSTNTAPLAVAGRPATAEPARSAVVADTTPQIAPAASLSSSPPPGATEQKSARENVAVAEEPSGTSDEVQNPPSSPGSSRSFRVGATTLACASFGCLLFFLRRSRSPARGSIVTQSLERESGCVRPPAAKPKAPKAPAQ